MRFMISARVPNEKLNALIKEGKFPQTFQSIMEELQPEVAYFTDLDGARGGYFIVNLDDAAELASKTEPLFQGHWTRRYKSHLVNTARGRAEGDAGLRASGTRNSAESSRPRATEKLPIRGRSVDAPAFDLALF